MIQVTSNLINETLVLQPSFQDMLPDKEHMSELMDTAVNNFYSVGRTWITKQVSWKIILTYKTLRMFYNLDKDIKSR